jgi:hypothetical protein
MDTYTIYDPTTFDVLYAQEFETQPENSTSIVMMESFVKPKFNPQTKEYYEGATQLESIAVKTEAEYQRYLQRKRDGEEYHLRICAELRVAKLAGGISQEQYDAIYAATAPARNEIVAGQWMSGLKEFEKLSGVLSSTLYNRIHTDITNYITLNYPAA